MARKKNNFGIGSFIFGFILLVLISVIVLVWGVTTYDGPLDPAYVVEESPENMDDQPTDDGNRKFGDIIDEENSEEDTEEDTEEDSQDDLIENNAEMDSIVDSDVEDVQTEITETGSNVGRRMYKQYLNTEEQKVYEAVVHTLEQVRVDCKVEALNCRKDELNDILTNAIVGVYYDYPEFFWFNGGAKQYKWRGEDGNYNVEIDLTNYDYWQYVLNKQGYIDEVNAIAQSIAAEAAKQGSTYEKVKYVHDYLVTNAEYDYDALEELNNTVQKVSSQQSHTVYGCLVEKLCVCDGYSKTFQMIMNLIGIESEFAVGSAGGPHAWNYITLDGENYWMDVTWDDADRRDENGNMKYPEGVDYGYFCITSENLAVTHTVDSHFPTPECYATEYNFFHKENSYLENYNFDALSNAIEEQKDEQIISVKFGSNNEMKNALSDLFEKNYRFKELPVIGNEEFLYSYDERHGILTFLRE